MLNEGGEGITVACSRSQSISELDRRRKRGSHVPAFSPITVETERASPLAVLSKNVKSNRPFGEATNDVVNGTSRSLAAVYFR